MKIENSKNVERVERERERAIFSKISFICIAKNVYTVKTRVDYNISQSMCNYSLPFL